MEYGGAALMKVTKTYSISEEQVQDWCNESGDSNPLHLDSEAAADSDPFDAQIVPGVMLLDRVSGLITEWSQTKEGTPVLSRMSGISFDAPVYIDQEIDISIEEVESDDDGGILEYTVDDDGMEKPLMNGYTTIYLI